MVRSLLDDALVELVDSHAFRCGSRTARTAALPSRSRSAGFRVPGVARGQREDDASAQSYAPIDWPRAAVRPPVAWLAAPSPRIPPCARRFVGAWSLRPSSECFCGDFGDLDHDDVAAKRRDRLPLLLQARRERRDRDLCLDGANRGVCCGV